MFTRSSASCHPLLQFGDLCGRSKWHWLNHTHVETTSLSDSFEFIGATEISFISLHHSGVASTTSAASTTETSGVQDCMSGTPIDYVSSTDVPICRHSTRLWAWSSSSPLVFLQNTRCSTHTYDSRRQKFSSRRTAHVEQFTGYCKTDHQLRTVWATSEICSGHRNRSTLLLLIIMFCIYTLTYLLCCLSDHKDATLVRGSSSVISLLNKLPPTQHSPDSFVVDVAISAVNLSGCWIFLDF